MHKKEIKRKEKKSLQNQLRAALVRYRNFYGKVGMFYNNNIVEPPIKIFKFLTIMRVSKNKFFQGVFGTEYRGFSKGDYDMNSISTRQRMRHNICFHNHNQKLIARGTCKN